MVVANIPCCSFCGKDQKSVGTLIAGNSDMFICDACVDVCNEVLAKPAAKSTEPRFEIVEQQMLCAVLQNFDETTVSDMKMWLVENDITTWIKALRATNDVDSFQILFENESDLVAFKLRWI